MVRVLLTGLFSVGSVGLTMGIGTELVSPFLGRWPRSSWVFCRDFISRADGQPGHGARVFILLTLLWLRGRWLLPVLPQAWGFGSKTPIVLLVFPVVVLHGLLARAPGRATLRAPRGSLRKLLAPGVLP